MVFLYMMVWEIPGKTGGSRDGPEGTPGQSNYRGTTTLFNSETFGLFLNKQIARINRYFYLFGVFIDLIQVLR